ncbi:MAG: NPCBM/NEW2 domain-containing protein [Pirellulales bacterium]
MNGKPSLALLACGLLAWALAARAAEVPLAVPVEGAPFRGQFTGAGSDWNLRFADGDARRDMPAADLATWGAFVEPARGIYLIPSGGGVIVVDNVRIQNEQLIGASPTFGNLSLPIEAVAGIIFRPPPQVAARDKLVARVLAPGGRSDRLLLENGDELTGTITTDGNRVVLKTDTDPWEVKIDTLRAIMFNPTLVDKPRASGLRSVVGFRDGSRVTAVELTTDGDVTRLKLAGGIALAAPTASIVALEVFGGRALYLSDVEPSSYRHIPYLQLSWPYQADRSVKGSQLRAGGRVYLKGLGMHSPSRLTYDLDQTYRRFDAHVAIDDDSEQRGSVVFRVFVDDGSGQWQERAASAVIRGGQPPVPISVDLDGVKRISLLVDFADRGDELDHADWLDARLVR